MTDHAATNRERALIVFAEKTLARLEHDSVPRYPDFRKDWTSDTTSSISAEAYRLGLARTNEDDCLFEVTRQVESVKMIKVCGQCGGDRISIEAFVSWSVEDQQFEVDRVCDKGHMCADCNGTTLLIDVEWKPLSMELTYLSRNGHDETTQIHRFDEQIELTAFRRGLVAGLIGACEITYTDEENEE